MKLFVSVLGFLLLLFLGLSYQEYRILNSIDDFWFEVLQENVSIDQVLHDHSDVFVGSFLLSGSVYLAQAHQALQEGNSVQAQKFLQDFSSFSTKNELSSLWNKKTYKSLIDMKTTLEDAIQVRSCLQHVVHTQDILPMIDHKITLLLRRYQQLQAKLATMYDAQQYVIDSACFQRIFSQWERTIQELLSVRKEAQSLLSTQKKQGVTMMVHGCVDAKKGQDTFPVVSTETLVSLSRSLDHEQKKLDRMSLEQLAERYCIVDDATQTYDDALLEDMQSLQKDFFTLQKLYDENDTDESSASQDTNTSKSENTSSGNSLSDLQNHMQQDAVLSDALQSIREGSQQWESRLEQIYANDILQPSDFLEADYQEFLGDTQDFYQNTSSVKDSLERGEW